MFKSFTFNNLNTPLTYIVTAATIPSLYFVKRVSLKLSIITAFGIYIFNVISKPAPKKACCGGKNKVNGKCCSGRKDCGPKVVKKKSCCGGKGNCSKSSSVSEGSSDDFEDLATDMNSKFIKK
ncbi:unnamed protein product [Hanseniaspora opuntiae]|jgi:hypothetical protein